MYHLFNHIIWNYYIIYLVYCKINFQFIIIWKNLISLLAHIIIIILEYFFYFILLLLIFAGQCWIVFDIILLNLNSLFIKRLIFIFLINFHFNYCIKN